ncbi:MAG TPA: YceI family protein [Thermoanaerobaculia bacterium]
MRMKALISLLMVATVAVATERIRFAPVSNSTIKITGTSTLHEWTVQSSTINGAIDIAPEIAADPADAASWRSEKPALVSVKIPVTDIKSEHARMTNIMLDALKAKSFPEIRYELLEAEPATSTEDAFTVKTKGKLTIAGVTRDLQMNVTAVRSGRKQFVLIGDAPINMTDYGITPPVTMLGALKTGDQVNVSFRWVVDRVQ